MNKPITISLLAAVLGFAVFPGAGARSAEVEGALQYPPREVGADAQPPQQASNRGIYTSDQWDSENLVEDAVRIGSEHEGRPRVSMS